MMIKWKEALILMRIPFSIFLMPMYWFALTQVANPDLYRALSIFIILHVFVYPASNGYNSYFDRDEGSIGGLKHPPPVNPSLYRLVVIFDLLAVLLSALLSLPFTLMVIIYMLVSKAYSYDKIRLKQYPLISAAVVTLFQGAFTFLMVQVGMEVPSQSLVTIDNVSLAAASTILLAGSYPLTQVYQHEEDLKRGDITISIKLGIKGTFYFSAISLLIGSSIIGNIYMLNKAWVQLMIFGISSCPVVIYFAYWMYKVFENNQAANFDYTMRMNQVASLSLSFAFILICIFADPI